MCKVKVDKVMLLNDKDGWTKFNNEKDLFSIIN